MKFTSLKNRYRYFISLGSEKNTSKSELKKIKLFNVFCYVWHLLTILMLIEIPFEKEENSLITLLVCMVMVVLIIGIQYIHANYSYSLARILFVFNIIILTFIFSNYTYKGELLEYYFLFPSAISLIFIDRKLINYIALSISYLCFVIPNTFFFDHYDINPFNDISVTFLFFSIFILVNYFKNLNIKNEKALQIKTTELEDLNASQAQFFINISHEIRTPLTLIKGQADTLKEFQNIIPQLIDVQDELNVQSNKIAVMVDDVLDIAKMEAGNFRLDFSNTNISELVSKIYNSFESNFKQKDIHYDLIKNSKDYMITANEVYLERALNNIIINALKYTDREGSVTIGLKRKKKEIIISVIDTGIGISQKDINKICNQFYQANNDINKAGGSGVGLAFSKEIIELHKGKLQISSKPEEGSEFKIILPLQEHKTIAKSKQYKKVEKKTTEHIDTLDIQHLNNHKILLVDDNWEMRKYLKSILKENECLEAEHGIQALDMIKNTQFDFIIVDYMMPKMNGLEFIQSLKAQKYDIPILMLTARTDKESRLEVFRSGIDDYLNKPFDRDELLIRIHNSLNNYRNRIKFIEKENIASSEIEQDNSWIKQVEKYIDQECSNSKLKLDDIAEQFNISISTLSRKIEAATGQKPKEFVKEIKLQKARRITEDNPEISLKKLSLEVGYAHSYNFSEIYFKRFGSRPWK
ncbi:hybrid sensor histidine kinase/response regulator transcription factor [Aquimarina sp. 2201CG14-23]|uniref:hybrid sensor histidine kinase/response regulator transcription factor n=1 Tax=Aquimarina mycalae TaxID=3040073 RepID=UPI0024781198|nr:response regulator [Aquimarina sp. 2201CG14-23]MDH7448407.1 response regulator [Aquimarina sp. 2201CG14-23]